MSNSRVLISKTSLNEYMLALLPYDQRVVNAIKTRVKVENRSYDPKTKQWTIHTSDAMRTLMTATRHWIDYEVL